MKKLLPLLVAVICVSGCDKLKYREKERPDPNEVLPSNVWEFENHFSFPTEPSDPNYCKLPHYLVFNKDKTGFYTYEHPCDSTTEPDTVKFTWSLGKDIYTLNQVVGANGFQQSKFVICDYDMLRFEMRIGNLHPYYNPPYIIDGNYKPKGN